MLSRIFATVRRVLGIYPVTASTEGVKPELRETSPITVGEHVRLPDGTWIHGAPRGGHGG